eukprot:542014-Amorphochlora_amoeboformis.AAC.1
MFRIDRGHFGVNRETLWGRSRDTLGAIERHFGVNRETLWGQYRDTLGAIERQVLGQSRDTLGSIEGQFGGNRETVWRQSRDSFRSIERQFGVGLKVKTEGIIDWSRLSKHGRGYRSG